MQLLGAVRLVKIIPFLPHGSTPRLYA